MENKLAEEFGIINSRSYKQLSKFFKDCGLLHNFKQGGKVSFNKDMLKRNTNLHPAIALLREARRASNLLSDKIISPELVGKDARVRAEHIQLGTYSGRQTSRWPNLLGLDRMLRPLIIPDSGYGIGEVDWSQMEVGIAAAIYGDDELVRMFNTGDVYSAMAQHFYKDKLPENDHDISGKEFKEKYKNLRNQMKSCTLGIIYGITPIGLVQTLRTTRIKAEALQKKIIAMFPHLNTVLTKISKYGSIRGYAYTITGLKRYRAKSGDLTHWERNWLTNHPVHLRAFSIFSIRSKISSSRSVWIIPFRIFTI